MDPAEQPDLDLDELREWWLGLLDRNLESTSFTAEELNDLARRYRISAETTASRGQQRAGYMLAERLERAARDRVHLGICGGDVGRLFLAREQLAGKLFLAPE